MKRQTAWVLVAGAAVFSLAGCGGSSSTTPAVVTPPLVVTPPPVTVTPPTTLSGTAAIGAPIRGTVFAIDVNGRISPPATTAALGAFTVDVAGMTAPFILSITGTAGGNLVTLNSIATAAGQTVNITPLTDLIVSTASGQPGGSALASLCAPVASVVPAACTAALTEAARPAKLDAAVAAVVAMISPINTAGTNPLTGAFSANGTGMDAILDQILVTPAEAQGAMATVTLVATSTALGSVTLPPAAGGTSTIPAATPPSSTQLAVASATATVLPEIKACVAALGALYPESGFVAPSAAAVTPFIDNSFSFGATFDKAAFIDTLTSTDDMAHAGLGFVIAGLSPVDMRPLTTTELATLTSSSSTSTTRVADFVNARTAAGATGVTLTGGVPSSAWVRINIKGQTGVLNLKMVKTADTAGCAGGWKLAGTGHTDIHMNARVRRSTDGNGVKTFGRELALHIDADKITTEGYASTTVVDVRGPGLTTLGDFNAGEFVGRKIRLIGPTTGNTVMRVADFVASNSTYTGSAFYGSAEAIQSCQDLKAVTTGTLPGSGTACYDETRVAPGKIYVWTLVSSSGPLQAFPFQINAVPLSRTFAIANEKDLFVTLTKVTPTSLLGLPVNTLLDGLVKFDYTQSATYESKMDNCLFVLLNGSTPVLNAEQNAVGKESSCTFATSGMNSLASNVFDTTVPTKRLFKFNGPVTGGYIGLSASVLGNQVGVSQPAP